MHDHRPLCSIDTLRASFRAVAPFAFAAGGKCSECFDEALLQAARDADQGLECLVGTTVMLLELGRGLAAPEAAQHPAAWAHRRLAAAADCAERDQRALWETVIDDPRDANLPTAARAASVSIREANRALGHLLQVLGGKRSHQANALVFVHWLEVFEQRETIKRRASRSPLQLYRLAALSRINATKRAAFLLAHFMRGDDALH